MQDCGCDVLGGEVEQSVICITVKMDTVLADDLSKREGGENKDERTKNRPLWDTTCNWGGGGFTLICLVSYLLSAQIKFSKDVREGICNHTVLYTVLGKA